MIDTQTRIQQNPRTAARVIEGKAVVIVIDQQKLHTLNEVGTFIWENAKGITVQQISDKLCQHFNVDPSTSLNDTTNFIHQLHNAGALHIQNEAV